MAIITTRAGKGAPLTNAELDANFTNLNEAVTTNVDITGGTITGITPLAIVDGGTGAADAVTARSNLGVAIGADVPSYASTTFKTSTTGAAIIPSGATSQRDAVPEQGYLRFNTDADEFEGWDGVEWASVGGAKTNADSTTDAELYPTFISNTSGTAKVVNVDDTKLTYNPAKGELKSDYLISESGIVMMKRVITKDTVIPSGYTAVVTEMEVGAGVTLEVAPGGFITNV